MNPPTRKKQVAGVVIFSIRVWKGLWLEDYKVGKMNASDSLTEQRPVD